MVATSDRGHGCAAAAPFAAQSLSSDGALFYATTGNDYRGDFRSVQAAWLSVGLGSSAVVAARVCITPAGPNQLSFCERELLQAAAWLEACTQCRVLCEPQHGGRPYVPFTELGASWMSRETEFGSWAYLTPGDVTAYAPSASTSGVAARLQFGSGVQLLQAGTLDRGRVSRHMYSTCWQHLELTEGAPVEGRLLALCDFWPIPGDANAGHSQVDYNWVLCTGSTGLAQLIQVAQSVPAQTQLWLCTNRDAYIQARGRTAPSWGLSVLLCWNALP